MHQYTQSNQARVSSQCAPRLGTGERDQHCPVDDTANLNFLRNGAAKVRVQYDISWVSLTLCITTRLESSG